MHQTFLRSYNEALVLALARATPTFERGDVAKATGLTPQAVSKVLARLLDDGVVVSAGERRPATGRAAAVYELVPGSRHAIGAHVSRRSLRLALTDLAGTVLDASVTPLPGDFTPGQLVDALTEQVKLLRNGHDRLTGVGIGMIGPLDHAAGTVRDAHRLRHWHDVPLAALAHRALGLPVHLDKDATAGVTAEAWRRGPGFRDAALIMVESGVGAGLWLNGTAHRGTHTNAGEFGHSVIQLDGPPCVCGRHGCLEAMHDQAIKAGDVDLAARILGIGIVNLLQTLDLGHVVLAGTDLLRHGPVYLDTITRAVRTQVPRADWLTVDVSLSALGADAIAAGAAMQILDARYGVPGLTA
ncbi:ROK family transcriptional regulator [Actinoplanes derwentensis]|uniref:Sugar kinase of the NBD/HSP70 family, may contain an N-terminal HTH domain n=1 Tax=Actinoplanes derwentensis TaxID=113562 RepID=A0A1H1S7Z7_9ACTN|nr:ROK family transcriptional regulator [Actinoplanes derwentensis]GID89680.1 sugar kinase [Actinoplanes derwentensis]SDS43429.1 Sugar kinase of the NBD/HSP70 family, may contain an N-terminal HTH domain [Actinoplanes derwentensis]